MPRRAKPLKAVFIPHLPRGRHHDGGGLVLLVRPSGRWWIARITANGKRREIGLGPAVGPAAVPLAEARRKAAELRRQARAGIDPLAERDAERARRRAEAAAAQAARITFETAMREYITAHQAGWRNQKHAQQWEATLRQHAASLLPMPVGEVATEHVLATLRPIWTALPETASRVRGRVEAVLDLATVRGWRAGENPARWRGHLSHLLPARAKVARVEHHAAVPWRELPAVMARLAESSGTAASCLRFAVLTAARSGEARGATWAEIDLGNALWTVPAARMKAGREHRVPLSDAAVALLREMEPLRRADGLAFPGGRVGRPLSDVSLAKALRLAGGGDATVHGMRSAFRDWASEVARAPREVAEATLAHANKDRVESAYLRSDFLDARRELMAAWARHCTGRAGAVVALRRPA